MRAAKIKFQSAEYDRADGADVAGPPDRARSDDTTAREFFAHICQIICPDIALKDVLHALPDAHPEGSTLGIVDRVERAMINLGCTVSRRQGSLGELQPWQLPALFEDEADGRVWLVLPDGQGARVLGTNGADDSLPFNARGMVHRFRRMRAGVLNLADQRRHNGRTWFRALLATMKTTQWALILTSLIGATLLLSQPLLIAAFYRVVFQNGDMAAVPAFAMALLVAWAARLSIADLRMRCLAWLAARLNFLVGSATFQQMLYLPSSFFQLTDAKDQAARIRSFESVSEFVTSPLAPLLLDLPIAVLALLLVFGLSPVIGLLLTAFVIAQVTLFLMAGKRMRSLTSALADHATDLQHVLVETFEKRAIIRECNLDDRWADIHYHKVAKAQRVQKEISRLTAYTEAGSNFVTTCGIAGVIGASALLVSQGALGFGWQLAMVVLCGMVLAPLQAICLSVPRFEQCSKVLAQINDFMDIPLDENLECLARPLPVIRGNLALRNVTMRNQAGVPVFMGLDFAINTGQIIGISGAAGTGKTMLLNTVQGIVKPSFGSVMIEGVDIRQLPLRNLRNGLGYVPQEPAFLPGSIADNLAFVNASLRPDQVAQAFRFVGLEGLANIAAESGADGLDALRHLPDGADVPWRFALAQALLTGSRLLLIDEIPNAVVNAGLGKVLQDLIRSARGRVTIMFVSQRTDLLQQADLVVGLRYGRVPVVAKGNELAQAA